MACPEGNLIYEKPLKFWDEKENVIHFLNEIKEKYNLQSIDDWNGITKSFIQSFVGGNKLLQKYSLFELKCLVCPEGKSFFENKIQQTWDNNNISQFLNKLKEKYNLESINDWNNITKKHICALGGKSLLSNYSVYDLKCLGCPEGKLMFTKPIQSKPSGYWDDRENVLQFLREIKEKFNLKTPKDWNLLSKNNILSCNGGGSLLHKYSMFDLKCLACPEGNLIYDKPSQNKPPGYWDDEENRNQFVEKLKLKYNLLSPQDWKRLSVHQIRSQGGRWLFHENNDYLSITKIKFEIQSKDSNNGTQFVSYSLKELLQSSEKKRSSQRWLFLQIQKLFPGEELVEDYFHSDISRESGFSVQFDVFMINKNIAIEYHGKQHYEDIPSGFAPLELHHNRDLEKEKLCAKYGIQLIVIPYWWDNKLNSLKETLYSKIKQ